jgi:NAD(P)-dependent dehydrogenase (short-subunit alcohol dehydrogenase family)
MRLEGKVAIVTGGGRGLGKAFCLKLAEEGAKVVVVDVIDTTGTVKEIEGRNGSAIGLKVDVSQEEDTQRMAKETVAKFGRIDVLVNNAAVFYGLERKSFQDISTEEWDRLMAVNVKGQWLCAKAVAPEMKKHGKGKIINVASNVAFTGRIGFLHYLTSKAAILGLTRGLAGELGEHGICVNSLCPGMAMTEARKIYTTDEQAVERAQKEQLIKRPQQPEDLVGIVAFLASDESDLMTGQTVVVDGGWILH